MKRKLLFSAIVICIVVFVFSSIMLYKEFADKNHSIKSFENVSVLVREEQSGTDKSETEKTVSSYEKYINVYEENSDFVGWINIPETNVDYPVMQTPNNPEYYLKRAFDKTYSNYGVPYVQWNCVVDESDNVVIHDHNMKNTAMFSDLCKYESKEFYDDHSTVNFDTLNSFGKYEIAIVLKTTAYSERSFNYYDYIDFESEEDFESFIEKCKSLELYDTGVSVEYGDRFITLSTCDFSVTNGRIAVIAKRIDNTYTEN